MIVQKNSRKRKPDWLILAAMLMIPSCNAVNFPDLQDFPPAPPLDIESETESRPRIIIPAD